MGTNLKHRFIDDSFDRLQTEKYNLSIRFAPDGFSFCISEDGTKKVAALGDIAFNTANTAQLMWEVENAISQEPILNGNFNKTNCIFDSYRYCLVPQFPDQTQNNEEIFSHTFEELASEKIFQNASKDDSTIVFAIPSPIEEVIRKKYSNVKFYAPIEPILHCLSEEKKLAPQIWIHIFDRICHILLYDNRTLSATTCRAGNVNDVVFQVLYLVKHLDLDPMSIQIYLSGREKICTSTASNISQYIKDVKVYCIEESDLDLPKSFDPKMLIDYSILIKQNQCE